MDITKLNFFNAVTGRMAWLNERQRVLAQNIANADTPNYKAMDLREPNFKTVLAQNGAGGLEMRATHAVHIGAGGRGQGRTFLEEEQKYEATPSGNAVVLEEEIMKVAQTTADYDKMTNLYKKGVSLMKMALGKK